MKNGFTRRDFLKLLSLLPFVNLSSSTHSRQASAEKPNILVLVFDTFSARNISLYGYPRETTPNLALFAEKSTVYHKHFSAGSHTTPGTSSLLTGAYPWSHRCFNPHGAPIDAFASQNLFSLFPDRYRLGFSHNLVVNIQLHHFRKYLDEFVLPREVALLESEFSDDLFLNDYGTAVISERTLLKPVGARPNSLIGYLILKIFQDRKEENLERQFKDDFPRGVTRYQDLVYLLEDSIDWVALQTETLAQPYLAYIHMMPPHVPYTPRREFVDIFLDDGFAIPEKPEHFFTEGRDLEYLDEKRRFYDEYIAFVDSELGRLLDILEQNSTLDNTWVLITSDHGEIFERGIFEHSTPVLYQPLVNIPLLIHAPGQNTREDIYATTSCVDVVPTLLHLNGRPKPDWGEGEVLPPFNSNIDSQRSVFALDAKASSKFHYLNTGTFVMVKGSYKLIYYRGYTGFDEVFELYDLENDPQELNDLSASKSALTSELAAELKTTITARDKPA
ncbi:MAG: sulfatase-like hydrolase/transferase [Anaerolineales bacterium]|jgi:choline-sulfatase